MILGVTTAAYTLLHVLISLAGIGSGFVVKYGLLTGKRLDRWTALFLVTTVATGVTGFGFRFTHLLPSTLSASCRWWCWRLPSSRATSFTSRARGGGPTLSVPLSRCI